MSAAQMGLAQHKGHSHSEETKHRISLAKMGQPSWMKGRTHSPEAIRKIKEARARQIPVGGWRHRPETLVLYSQQRLGKPSGFKGRKHTKRANRKNRLAHLGLRLSKEHKAKISASLKGRKKSEELILRQTAWLTKWDPNRVTELERRLYSILEHAGFLFCKQFRIGRFIADAWVPEYRLVFEADGAPWHTDKERELLRDAALLSRGVLAVIHLVKEDLFPVEEE